MSQYCIKCGQELAFQEIEGRQREICKNCGWINYEHRKVSAGVRVTQDGRLLMVQRGIEPWYGCWYMPAGFVEVDEEPQDAAIREGFEETGLQLRVGKIADIYTYSDDPRGNGVVLLYDAEVTGGTLRTSNETLMAGFYLPEEIVGKPLAGACTEKQVHDWLKSRKNSYGS